MLKHRKFIDDQFTTHAIYPSGTKRQILNIGYTKEPTFRFGFAMEFTKEIPVFIGVALPYFSFCINIAEIKLHYRTEF